MNQLIKPKNEFAQAASERFQAFCNALNIIKEELNSTKLGWCDKFGAEMYRFHTLGVERALFTIAKQLDNCLTRQMQSTPKSAVSLRSSALFVAADLQGWATSAMPITQPKGGHYG